MGFSSEFSDTNSELFDQKEISVTDSGVEAITDQTSTDGRECRQFVRIFNNGPDRVYFGPSGVTAPGGANPGEPLAKRQWVEIAVRDQEVHLITDTGDTADVIVTDLG